MDELLKLDPTFSLSTFLTKADNIYVMLCTSIMTNNLNRVAHYISDELYDEKKSYLDKLNSENVIQMYDELNVKSTNVLNVEITDDKYIITVELISRYMDYKIDKTTRKYVSGNNTSRIEKVNKLVFTKKRTFTKLGTARSCPKCGANMDLNNTGVCKFCGSIFEQDDHDWILTKIN